MARRTAFLLTFAAAVLFLIGCGGSRPVPVSASGVKKAEVEVPTNPTGHTIEQENILERVRRDNKPGSVKHLYVISAYSGQVLIYSTVKGKVTSSGKRLTPYEVSYVWNGTNETSSGFQLDIGRKQCATREVLQDDGTYGSSIPYLFWFSSDGRYHQHYLGGGEILHISDQPLNVKSIVLNLETKKDGE